MFGNGAIRQHCTFGAARYGSCVWERALMERKYLVKEGELARVERLGEAHRLHRARHVREERVLGGFNHAHAIGDRHLTDSRAER